MPVSALNQARICWWLCIVFISLIDQTMAYNGSHSMLTNVARLLGMAEYHAAVSTSGNQAWHDGPSALLSQSACGTVPEKPCVLVVVAFPLYRKAVFRSFRGLKSRFLFYAMLSVFFNRLSCSHTALPRFSSTSCFVHSSEA